jgi:formylglycine-generating enzyme required for sulfatase activity
MNFDFNIVNIKYKLKDIKINLDRNTLYNELIRTFKQTKILTDLIYSNRRLELQCNSYYGKTNPLKWQLGNLIYFWQNYCCKYLGIDIKILNKNIYDEFRIDYNNRFLVDLVSIDLIYDILEDLNEKISKFIFNRNSLNNFEKFILRFSQLYNDHINEDIITILQIFNIKTFDYNVNYNKSLLTRIEFIDVPEGDVLQGTENSFNGEFYFDNEYPPFKANINSFKVSKYCITNYQFLQFVISKGYSNNKYWSNMGWRWKLKKKINHPINWEYDDYYKGKEWREKIHGKYHILRMNNPVMNISYHEAYAYCNWSNCRLLKESEWEYLTTFYNNDGKLNSNLNCLNGTTISVLDDKNINKLKIVGLYGNVWEWCLENYNPYDGFISNPIYKEYSYPKFGKKAICKGGSWCTPDYLIKKSYRRAEDLECNHKFIGFRVVKK